MSETNRPTRADLSEGTRAGLAAGLRTALAGVTGEPLPMQHIELLLALRRRERERDASRTR